MHAESQQKDVTAVSAAIILATWDSAARGRPIIVEWERDARHSAGLSLVRRYVGHYNANVAGVRARDCLSAVLSLTKRYSAASLKTDYPLTPRIAEPRKLSPY
ncbi:hypothetical protein EVAR_23689_1 [Eumeta japonica]|uniref:Uncharacterized protein n=1 Tax=Eumeta variegata TaxID=151549 RepID=A0A4C1VJB0_EUMVA|nr:hypothetical protein EVAR_23689_1 [Eumeta japonica]